MPLRINRTAAANRDLYAIWRHIRGDNMAAADRVIRRFNELFEKLAINPELGRGRPELTPQLRSFPEGHYSIFYRANATTLTVVRVLSSYRELGDQAFPER